MRDDTKELGAAELVTDNCAMIELTELQLGFVGGGTGEVVIA